MRYYDIIIMYYCYMNGQALGLRLIRHRTGFTRRVVLSTYFTLDISVPSVTHARHNMRVIHARHHTYASHSMVGPPT